MKVVGITQGADQPDGAFCLDKLSAAGIDAVRLSEALAKALGPFVPLLKDGHGFGATLNGESGSVIGFTSPDN